MTLFQGFNKANSFTNYLKLLVLFVFVVVLEACNSEASFPPKQVSVNSQEGVPFYNALIGELYIQIGEEHLAVDHYLKAASLSKDSSVSKRVTELATVTGQLKKGLESAKRWVQISPEDVEARQYLILLYLRNNQFKLASTHLHEIYLLLDATKPQNNYDESEALNFIGTLLAAESHHNKAFEVFDLFLKNHTIKESRLQQTIILASLAMKAKKYQKVVMLLTDLSDLNKKNFVDVSAMQAKALAHLHQDEAAIQILQSIVKNISVNDSTRLELVRLLVRNQQKQKGFEILQELVNKHQHNNELLKSLISLQIDLSLWGSASLNINRLAGVSSYKYDAEYFRGEILESQGVFDKALKKYKQVKGGVFLRQSHKKVISLILKLSGLSDALNYINKQKTTTKKIKVKAYWSKLEADLYFASNNNKKALSLYSLAIELSPKNNAFRYYRGLCHVKMGSIILAEKDFRQILKEKKNDVDALNALGYMLITHTTRLEEAKTYIEKAYSLEPNDPVILDSIGWLNYKRKDFISAEQFLSKSYQSIKNPEVATHLIRTLIKLGQSQKARDIYNEIRIEFPNNEELKNTKHFLSEI
jgi:Flp pilus assembly protein TadD